MPQSLKGAKILVTGGTGFLGRHLLPILREADAQVTCLCRSRPPSAPRDITYLQGDCLDFSSVHAAARQNDIIIHAAGLLFGSSWEDYIQANYRMASHVGETAQGRKVIFISSLAAAGPSQTPKRETEPSNPVSAYGWSKLMAEQALQSCCKNLAILRPPIIFGSGDRGLLPLFRSCGRGLGITSGDFPLSIIHAQDCGTAIRLICETDSRGIYHLSDGEIYNLGQICAAMAKAQGRNHIMVVKTPKPILRISANISTGFHGLRAKACEIFKKNPPRPPSWNMDKLREALQVGWVADNGKICADVGFAPRYSLYAGMEEAVKGYREDGWL